MGYWWSLFLYYRNNSQKPNTELIQKFQRTFSDVIPGATRSQGRHGSVGEAVRYITHKIPFPSPRLAILDLSKHFIASRIQILTEWLPKAGFLYPIMMWNQSIRKNFLVWTRSLPSSIRMPFPCCPSPTNRTVSWLPTLEASIPHSIVNMPVICILPPWDWIWSIRSRN